MFETLTRILTTPLFGTRIDINNFDSFDGWIDFEYEKAASQIGYQYSGGTLLWCFFFVMFLILIPLALLDQSSLEPFPNGMTVAELGHFGEMGIKWLALFVLAYSMVHSIRFGMVFVNRIENQPYPSNLDKGRELLRYFWLKPFASLSFGIYLLTVMLIGTNRFEMIPSFVIFFYLGFFVWMCLYARVFLLITDASPNHWFVLLLPGLTLLCTALGYAYGVYMMFSVVPELLWEPTSVTATVASVLILCFTYSLLLLAPYMVFEFPRDTISQMAIRRYNRCLRKKYPFLEPLPPEDNPLEYPVRGLDT